MNLPDIGSKLDMLMAMRAHRLHDHLAGHAGNRLLAGWINVRDEDEVGADRTPGRILP